ncbi:hypothetical protein B0I28_10669 [Glycomyces artemisiae]|uniref:Uncharacterized protein n=1 Tax=Glycomyces artemisiae TaxID=1076443 RepID=A0A2T0UI75_9ACTN|nr:hypothetical protein B0I28_10669 [Glycomyces artemisiae]
MVRGSLLLAGGVGVGVRAGGDERVDGGPGWGGLPWGRGGPGVEREDVPRVWVMTVAPGARDDWGTHRDREIVQVSGGASRLSQASGRPANQTISEAVSPTQGVGPTADLIPAVLSGPAAVNHPHGGMVIGRGTRGRDHLDPGRCPLRGTRPDHQATDRPNTHRTQRPRMEKQCRTRPGIRGPGTATPPPHAQTRTPAATAHPPHHPDTGASLPTGTHSPDTGEACPDGRTLPTGSQRAHREAISARRTRDPGERHRTAGRPGVEVGGDTPHEEVNQPHGRP